MQTAYNSVLYCIPISRISQRNYKKVTKMAIFLIFFYLTALLQHNWADTCDFQQCGIFTSVDSDEPVQPPFKLWNSKWCSVSSLTVIEYSSD